MVKVKFCGMKRLEDALDAARLGVHALGFIFVKTSPRYILPQEAQKIISQLPPFVVRVGVFSDQNEKEISQILSICELDAIQFHGQESPQFCKLFLGKKRIIKVFRVKDESFLEEIPKYDFVDAILLDSFHPDLKGGTGRNFNWQLARKARRFGIPVILSGGLNPDNIKQAIAEVNPYAVDVASGIEKSPGIKDHELMAKFIAQVWEEEWGY
jgi:phosphoribosylanthranilate isomerase